MQKSMQPSYTIDTIKFGTDAPTFERAVVLYDGEKVHDFTIDRFGYSARVIGTQVYDVTVSARSYDKGNCNCYLGQDDVLCKHMVAGALFTVKQGQLLTQEERRRVDMMMCSEKIGTLTSEELLGVKQLSTEALTYIKSYISPSRLWFRYQNSLDEGCSRLAHIVSRLPVSKQAAALFVKLLLRLDKKVSGGVDDSNGTVGNCMEDIVEVLKRFAALEPLCAASFSLLKNKETCFGWEEPLTTLLKTK